MGGYTKGNRAIKKGERIANARKRDNENGSITQHSLSEGSFAQRFSNFILSHTPCRHDLLEGAPVPTVLMVGWWRRSAAMPTQ